MNARLGGNVQVLERRLKRAAPDFAQAAFLHTQARAELLRRLEPVKLEPAQILVLGGGAGLEARALADRYRKAAVTLVDASPAMLEAAGRLRGWWRRFNCVRGEASALPIPDASVDLVVANMLLPNVADPLAVLAEVRRVLKPRGYFVFTTVGATTLQEVRAAFAAVDNTPHVIEFPDFHDVGDGLTRVGFVAPVLDADRLSVTYRSLQDVCRDLRAAGASLPLDGRKTLTGRRRWRVAEAAFAGQAGPESRIAVTCEVIYGQAWCPDGDQANRAGSQREVVVPLTRLRRRD
jgi:malonyl-CoA O-methyltransferase